MVKDLNIARIKLDIEFELKYTSKFIGNETFMKMI